MARLVRLLALVVVLRSPALYAVDLNIGDDAPPLQIADWIRGGPVDLREGQGKNVYFIEFWATWCAPCIESIPHLSELQKKYEDQNLVVIGVTDEPRSIVEPWMKKVERKGKRMDYVVASDKLVGRQGKTNTAYLLASGQMGIPTSFIVDRQGKVAWIGHPMMGDAVLDQVIKGKYDIAKAKETAAADQKFITKHQTELMISLRVADWKRAIDVAKTVADPTSRVSNDLRIQVLNTTSWIVLTDDNADPKYFADALSLAEVAMEACREKDPSVLDTYARALFLTGKIDDAIKYQKRAIELAPEGLMRQDLIKSLEEFEKAQQD